MITVRDIAINFIGCCVNTALVCKSFSCCTKYTPQHFSYICPLIVGAFIYTIHAFYGEGRQILEDWHTEEDHMIRIKKLRFLVRKAKIQAKQVNQRVEKKNRHARSVNDDVESGGNRTRRNHRGGVNIKNAKGTVEGDGPRTARTSNHLLSE